MRRLFIALIIAIGFPISAAGQSGFGYDANGLVDILKGGMWHGREYSTERLPDGMILTRFKLASNTDVESDDVNAFLPLVMVEIHSDSMGTVKRVGALYAESDDKSQLLYQGYLEDVLDRIFPKWWEGGIWLQKFYEYHQRPGFPAETEDKKHRRGLEISLRREQAPEPYVDTYFYVLAIR